MSSFRDVLSHPFSTTWRKALVSLPRLVPDSALYITSPDGPQPFVLKLPAFNPNKHLIPVYVFVYVPPLHQSSPHTSSPGPDTPQASLGDAQAGRKSTLVSKTAIAPEIHSLNLPVLIDFHGGSFILGTPQEQAPFCSQMAREIGAASQGGGCVVISVDYRLGPYAQYPAANEDAEDVVRAVLEETSKAGKVLREAIRETVTKLGRDEAVDIDNTRIALSGFSSGGNLALTLAQSVKNDPTINRDWPSVFPRSFRRSIPILLFYPSLDSRILPDERPRPPGLDPPAGFFTRLKIESELMPKYLPSWQRDHPRASPGLAPIADGGLHPKAKLLLVLPELDSLSEQSMAWIKKVEAEGRKDDLVIEKVPGVMHGFTQFPDSWIKDDEERQKKYQVFETARQYILSIWESDNS